MAYDPTASGGSNLGPTSQKLHDTIAQNISDYRTQNNLDTNAPVPADAVTASASGLDPHISLRNAELQTPRVAKARGLSEARVRELVRSHTDGPSLGFLGRAGRERPQPESGARCPGASGEIGRHEKNSRAPDAALRVARGAGQRGAFRPGVQRPF